MEKKDITINGHLLRIFEYVPEDYIFATEVNPRF